MWYAAVVRFIRRRIVLGLIFTFSLTYCIVSFVSKSDFLDGDDMVQVRRTQPFIWRTLQQHNVSGSDTAAETTCRNSVQGKALIADDRGFVCPRHEILPNGCCSDTDNPQAVQYSCDSCLRNNCCSVYEHCISCCLHPDKKDVLENVLRKASDENSVLFASVTDHFELCLAKCRTNSQSVQHENSYKDPKAKHCFGDTPPGGGLSIENEV